MKEISRLKLLSAGAALLLAGVAPIPTPARDAADPTPADPGAANAAAVDLPVGLATPRADASATEKFLYQLAVLTRHYYLDMAYRPKVADDELDDAHWTVERSAAVASLLRSPLAAGVPAELRDFCAESQRLDGAFQAIAKFAFDSAERGRNSAMDMLSEQIFGVPGKQRQSADPDLRLFAKILKFNGNTSDWLRARALMLRNFAQYKRDRAFHTRWASLLADLAKSDPGLTAYAAQPEATDPTLHYMRNHLAGDVFPGATVSPSRAGPGPAFLANAVNCDLGDIRREPVRVRLPKRGFAFYNLSMTGASYGMVFAGQCNRGHLGFYNDSLMSAWTACGMTDGKKHGRFEFPGEDSGRGVHIQVKLCHMPAAGRDSNEEVDGWLLIYMGRQYSSDADAAAASRTIDLSTVGQSSSRSR